MARHTRTSWPTVVSVDIITKDAHRLQLTKRVEFTEPPSTQEIHPELAVPVVGFHKAGRGFRAQLAPQECENPDEALVVVDIFQRQLGFTS